MFSIGDTIDTGEPIELDLSNYTEVGHHHIINEVDELENRLEAIEAKINEITEKILNITNFLQLENNE